MFISNCKIFNVPSSGGVYGLEKEQLTGEIVHFVNERVGAEAIIVIISVCESKKHTSIDSDRCKLLEQSLEIKKKNICLEILDKFHSKLRLSQHKIDDETWLLQRDCFFGKKLYHVPIILSIFIQSQIDITWK